MLEPYLGYATPERLVLRGRFLSALKRATPQPDQSRWTNLRQMVRLFLTDEVAGVPVSARGVRALSDDEGYVRLEVPRHRSDRGWARVVIAREAEPEGVPAEEAQVGLRALVPRKDARLGVISDIDDTILHTGAWRPVRMLWISLTGNVLTRQVYPDAAALLRSLCEKGRNPVYYVSSSPWNLHDFLGHLFRRADLPEGPMMLRDFGLSEGRIVSDSHGAHKGAAIDALLAANPRLPFVLLGDTGQHDAEIYRAAARRHPGRMRGVALRTPGHGTDAADEVHIRALREDGIPVHVGRTFTGALEALGETG
ncbi:App1 family protein [Histidinibacterium lentulum]|uniref:App1 family protein n=1 Tax=Histidinibacterium lentulum TaxID=2480588 RepID=UPI001617AA45|nr:phosphatase domain-containing protein [Histidinibacterium lentulum]